MERAVCARAGLGQQLCEGSSPRVALRQEVREVEEVFDGRRNGRQLELGRRGGAGGTAKESVLRNSWGDEERG